MLPRWLALMSLCVSAASGFAQDVRHYGDNGQNRTETPQTVRRPVSEVTYETQARAVYETRNQTEMQTFARPVYVPVTQYQWVPRWHGWWRVFRGPHVAYHLMPQTVWTVQRQEYQLPSTRLVTVPSTTTAQVPRAENSFVQGQEATREPVGTLRSNSQLLSSRPTFDAYADLTHYGGIARMDADPPRYGPVASSGGWRPRR